MVNGRQYAGKPKTRTEYILSPSPFTDGSMHLLDADGFDLVLPWAFIY